MKRLLALILVFALCFSIAACKKKADEPSNDDSNDTSSGSTTTGSNGGNNAGSNNGGSNAGTNTANTFTNAVYLKDKQLWYSDYTTGGTYQLTEKLANFTENNEAKVENLFFRVFTNATNTKLFYPDYYTFTDNIWNATFTLYCRDLTNKSAAPIKISENIDGYIVNNAGTKVMYIQDNAMYVHDLTTATKIADNAVDGLPNEDMSKLFYITQDGEDSRSIYLWTASGKTELLSDKLESIENISPDLSFVFYTETDGKMYKHNLNNNAKELIDTDVHNSAIAYKTGEFYYYKKLSSVEKPLSAFLLDDMKASDAAMVDPYTLTFTDDTAREQAYAAWAEKSNRDRLREEINSQTITVEAYSLYYYNGTSSVKLADNLTDSYPDDASYDKPIFIVQTYNPDKKAKISEITESWDVWKVVNSGDYAIVYGKNISTFPVANADDYVLSEDGSTLHITTKPNSQGLCDLYKVTVTTQDLSAPVLVDTNVYVEGYGSAPRPTFKNSVLYYKDCTGPDIGNPTGTLYVDGKKIAENVCNGAANAYTDDAFIYATDYDTAKYTYTLYMYRNDNSVKVAEKASSWNLLYNNNLLYLTEYSYETGKGDLHYYSAGTGASIKVDSGVSELVYVYSYANILYG